MTSQHVVRHHAGAEMMEGGGFSNVMYSSAMITFLKPESKKATVQLRHCSASGIDKLQRSVQIGVISFAELRVEIQNG